MEQISPQGAANGEANADVAHLLRPLSARSLIASALLGSHPPELPGRLLVAMAERFGLSGGTARVALSRMVDRGELVNENGTYALDGELLERQERQDRSRRRGMAPSWDGTWEQAVVVAVGRSSAERAKLRSSLAALGLGELREGVWMRPANLDPDRLPSARSTVSGQVAWYRVAGIDQADAGDLVARLFDLDAWAATADGLQAALRRAHEKLDRDDDAVVSGFNLASASLQHLVHDPQLPPDLAPRSWPADGLRRAYDEYESAYQRLLRAFFRTAKR